MMPNHCPQSIYKKSLTVLSCNLPVKLIGEFNKRFKEKLLHVPKVRNVIGLEDTGKKKILLSEKFGTQKDQLPEDLQKYIAEKEVEVEEHHLELGYENISCQEALEKIIPEGIIIPSGFESVGHIAHLNLNEDQMKYKKEIGKIIMDKTNSIRTVLTKVGYIKNVYRTYDFEVLAGEETFETTQAEDGVKFDVDVSKVYWCSKLAQERTRVIDQFFGKDDVVCDMFCGIGPLSVRAAKAKGVKVLANDLNPECYHYLRRNIVNNKVADLVLPYCMDAREFVKH